MTRDDTEREINLLFKDAEKFKKRCDTRLLNTLPELRLKIESLEGTEYYNEYINKFYEIRDTFKLDCMCGRKSRIEAEEIQEREFEAPKGDTSWFEAGLSGKLEELIKYHKGEK